MMFIFGYKRGFKHRRITTEFCPVAVYYFRLLLSGYVYHERAGVAALVLSYGGVSAVDWEEKYRSGHVPWLRPDLNPAFVHWFDSAMPGAVAGLDVVIPGCGSAPEVVAFAQRGAQVTAIDLAPSAIAAQAAMLVRAGVTAQLVQGDVLSWRPPRPVDLIYEQTCLCAIPPSLRPAYAGFAREILKPGGRLFALFMQTESDKGPPYHCDMAEMGALFDHQAWSWPSEQSLRSAHPAGMSELGFVLTRRA